MSGCWTRVFLAYSLGTKVEVSCSLLLWEGSFWQCDETWDLRSGFCHIVFCIQVCVSRMKSLCYHNLGFSSGFSLRFLLGLIFGNGKHTGKLFLVYLEGTLYP
jgi:hypothetical protein